MYISGYSSLELELSSFNEVDHGDGSFSQKWPTFLIDRRLTLHKFSRISQVQGRMLNAGLPFFSRFKYA